MTTTPTPPTDDELAAMRARKDAAYPFERGGYFDIEYCKVGDRDTFMLAGALVNTEETAQTDREFITHARTDIDTLLAEVERLRKMVADLQDEKQDLEDEAISGVIERMSGNY